MPEGRVEERYASEELLEEGWHEEEGRHEVAEGCRSRRGLWCGEESRERLLLEHFLHLLGSQVMHGMVRAVAVHGARHHDSCGHRNSNTYI